MSDTPNENEDVTENVARYLNVSFPYLGPLFHSFLHSSSFPGRFSFIRHWELRNSLFAFESFSTRALLLHAKITQELLSLMHLIH